MRNIKKILSVTLIVLIVGSIIRFWLIKPKEVKADALLGFNEGYGTTVNDNNSSISGTITNALWRSEEYCKVGKCLYFDGTGDLVNFGDDADMDFAAATNFTIEGWFRTPDITSGQRTLVAKHNATAGGYKVYMDSNGYLIFGVDDDSTWTPDDTASTSTVAFDDNKWHHFAAVKTGTTSISLYVDGNLYQTDSSIAATGTLVNSDTFYIGIDGNGSSNGFSGFLDEIKVYTTTARSQSEIKTDVAGETASRGSSALFGPTQDYLSNGLVGHWKLDETSGNVADSSGNGLTLTNNGTTTFVGGKFGNGSEHVPASSQHLSTATTISGVKTVSFWTNPDSTTNYMISLTSGAYITASSGTISATGFTNPSIFVNGASSTTLTQDVWQLVTVTTGTAIDANQFYVGRQGSNYYDGTLDEVRLYNTSLSPSQVSNLYAWAPGPVGHWKMDENTGTTAQDSSGNDNAGTLTNTPSWTLGKYSSGVLFEGSNQHITRADDSDFDFADDTDMSFETWFKHTTASAQEIIISKFNEAGYKMIMESDGDITCAMDYDSTWSPTDSATSTAATYDDNNWHHIACVKSGATSLSLYIDGVLIAQDTSISATNTLTNSDPIYFGIDADGTSNDFTGSLDDIRIYNYARTPTKIVEDMNGGHPAPGSPVGSAVAYWKFDEGYSTTAYDSNSSTGGAENLTLSTASWTNSAKFGKAFNGLTNVRASRTDDDDLDFVAGEDFTFSLWFKSDSATNPSANEYLLEKGGNIATDAIGYAVYTSAASDGLICFGIDDDASAFPEDEVCSSSDLYDNSWHHITMVKTGNSRLDLYVDGKANGTPDTSISATGTLANASTFYIGDTNGTDGTDEFLGDIDEVKIYRSPLSSDQVKIEYLQGSGQQLGAVSTNSSNNPSWSDTDSYCPPGQGSACTPPIAHWKLDDNTGTSAVDSSTNGFTMTLYENTTSGANGPTWSNGKLGGAGFFPGTNDVMRINGENTAIDLGAASDQYTMSAWFKTTTNAAQQQTILGKYSGSGFLPYSLYLNASEFGCFQIANSGSTDEVCGSTALNDGAWHHITGVRDGATNQVLVYIDGVLVDSETDDTADENVSNNSEVSIGNGGAPGCGCYTSLDFTGDIDNVIIYNYVRTHAQIEWDFNKGKPHGWWKLDEGSGTTANDSSGFGNSGTLTNSPTWTTGKYNGAVNFAGSNQHITRADDADFDFVASTPFTITGWFKHNTASTTEAILTKLESSGTDGGYKLKMESDGDITCETDDDDADTTIDDTATTTLASYDDNSWHHVACVYDTANTDLHIYIDGQLIVSNTSTTTNSLANDDALFIGIESATGTEDWIGDLDDIRIYRYALSAQQVKTVMNEGTVTRF